MSRFQDSLGLSPASVVLLRDLIHDRTGLFYDEGRATTMADRLAPLVANRGFASFLDYYYFLKYDAAAVLEWPLVMDALAVPETYFWREIEQLKAISDCIVPQVARAPWRPVRIWSIPCASGEEPLTLAMLLAERGASEWVEIEASDASPDALASARAGLFRERSFRTLPAPLRERYFEREGQRWRVRPELHRRVQTWSCVNLFDEGQIRARAGMDIVLCRNLFIYFSESAIRRVVDVLAETMSTPGYLCVGVSESLLRVTDRFDLEQIGEAFVYVKRSAGRRTDA